MLSAQTSGPVVVARAQDGASSRKTGLYFARLLPALFSDNCSIATLRFFVSKSLGLEGAGRLVADHQARCHVLS